MFTVEQGITSPRDNTVSWRDFEVFDNLADAKKSARKFSKDGSKWRIVENVVIWNSSIDK